MASFLHSHSLLQSDLAEWIHTHFGAIKIHARLYIRCSFTRRCSMVCVISSSVHAIAAHLIWAHTDSCSIIQHAFHSHKNPHRKSAAAGIVTCDTLAELEPGALWFKVSVWYGRVKL